MTFKVHNSFICISCHQKVNEQCKRPTQSRCKACKRKHQAMAKQIERNAIKSDPVKYAAYLEYNRKRTKKENLKPEVYAKRLERGRRFNQSEKGKAYYKQANKLYRERNPERVKDTQRRYAEGHREQMRLKWRSKYWRNPEKYRAENAIRGKKYHSDPRVKEYMKIKSRRNYQLKANEERKREK